MCWYLFRLYRFRTGCNLHIWCQIRKLIVISVIQPSLCPWETADMMVWWLLRRLRVFMKAFDRHCWVIRWISSHWKSGLGEMLRCNNLKIKHATLFNFRCDARDGKGALGEKSVLKRLTCWSLKLGVNLKAHRLLWARRMIDYRGLNASLLSPK